MSVGASKSTVVNNYLKFVPNNVAADAEFQTTVEPANFGHALDIALTSYVLYQVNPNIGVGVYSQIGFAFSRDRIKFKNDRINDALDAANRKIEFYVNENLFVKLGLAVAITEWLLIAAGLRTSWVSFDLDHAQNASFAGVPTLGGVGGLGRINETSSAGTIQLGWFTDVNIMIPISDSFKGIITLGLYGHSYEPYFNEAADIDFGAPAAATKFSFKTNPRIAARVGLGIAYEF